MRTVLLVFLLACGAGGHYAQNDRKGGDVDRGEVNGRVFELISHKPEGDDWQIRLRGNSMFVAYGNEDKTDKLGGNIQLSDKESDKAWKMIEAVDITGRKKGKKDEDEGYVQLVLHEPGEEDHADITEIFVSRATADDEVIDLAEYFRTLIGKYRKEKPNF